jgi:hypothetical protein
MANALGRRRGVGCLVAALFLAVLAPNLAGADAPTITFDDLTAGTVVTNQYADAGGPGQGVVFGPAPGGQDSHERPVIAAAPGQAVSGSQVARIDCPTCTDGGGFVPDTTGAFAAARSQISVYVGDLGSPVTVCGGLTPTAGCADVTLKAYDSAGQLVGTPATAQVMQGGPFARLSVSAPSADIVGFEIAGSASDSSKEIAIDDLSSTPRPGPPAPDFTLTSQSTSIAVMNGQSASDVITIGRTGGSSGTIQLQASGLPPGVSAQFAPSSASSKSTLTLTADASAPATAVAAVTITGIPSSASAGTHPHTLALSLQVESVCADVVSGQELINAVLSGCKDIHVDDSAQIDLARLSQLPGFAALDVYDDPQGAVLHIPDGVTLESDRSPRHAGGRLYMSANLQYPTAMLALRAGDHITGLRLQGYSRGRGGDETWTIDPTNNIGTTDGLSVSQPDILIDNNEISNWPGSGVNVHAVTYANWPPGGQIVDEARPPKHSQEDDTIAALATRVRITNNYIHDNVGCADGYGVSVGTSGFALIDRNVFDYNKHDVAGDGEPGTGYVASSNLVLTDGVQCRGDSGGGSLTYGGHFDMHGTAGPVGGGHVGGTAGTYIEIRNNAIRGDQRFHTHLGLGGSRRAAFDIRGTPTDKAIFADNVTEASGDDALAVSGSSASDLSSANKLIVYGNSYSVNTSGDLAAGDFDGDGCTDAFLATGAVWVYSPCGSGAWRYLNTSVYRLGQLAFGDFNGDGKTDVFTQRGDRWYVSYGARTAFEPLPAGSNIPMSDYRIGDFNGDGKADIFRANGSQWYYSAGGATQWRPLAASSYKVANLRLCDFNGDGKTDVFSLANGQWSVSYGGSSSWQRLNSKLSSDIGELVFGDFNGDGRCDIARAYHQSWQISWGGTSSWHYESPNHNPGSFSSTLIGQFAGGKCDDVLRFGGDGYHLERFQISRCLTPFVGWSRQNML